MQKHLNTLYEAKDLLLKCLNGKTKEIMGNEHKQVFWKLKACHELSGCSVKMREGCRVFKDSLSCWLNTNRCSCPMKSDTTCDMCPVYRRHILDMDSHNLKGKNKAARAIVILEHFKPIFERFLPERNNNTAKFKRKSRVMKLIALQVLLSGECMSHVSLERYLTRVYERIFQA